MFLWRSGAGNLCRKGELSGIPGQELEQNSQTGAPSMQNYRMERIIQFSAIVSHMTFPGAEQYG